MTEDPYCVYRLNAAELLLPAAEFDKRYMEPAAAELGVPISKLILFVQHHDDATNRYVVIVRPR